MVAARGWADVGATICSECVVDAALVEAIVETGGVEPCEYCQKTPILPNASAPIEVVLELVLAGLRHEYEDPIEQMGWEGGWQGAAVHDTWDLIYDLEVADREDVHGDLVKAIEQDQWCQRNPYAATPTEALKWGWEGFSDFVRHHRRYTFFMSDDSTADGAGELPMHNVLTAVAEAVEVADLVASLPAGTKWWRARVHDPGKSYTLAKDIGSPPAEIAKDNRMSPKGISVFYGASTEKGAQDEVAGYAKPTQEATAGCFASTLSLTVVDLREPPSVPSLFASNRHLRAPTQFLHAFIADVTKVADPSDEQNLDYVPTQIVAEYFCQALEGDDGAVHGVLWRSSKDPGVTSCVLFIPSEEVADMGAETPTTRLVLDPSTVTELPAPL